MGSAPTRQIALATFLVTGVLYAACGGGDETPFEPVAPITPGVSFTLDSDGDSYSCHTVVVGGFDINVCVCDDTDNAFFYSYNECLCSFNCITGGGGGGGGSGGPPPGDPPPGGEVQATVEVWCSPKSRNETTGPSMPVERGQEVKCGYTAAPAGVIVPEQWSIMGTDVPSNTKQGGQTWSGIVAVGGTVTLTWNSGGPSHPSSDSLQVEPRTWSWDASHRTFATGAAGDLDNCMSSTLPGLTADKVGCTSFNPVLINPSSGGFETAEGTGPNAGVFYVINPTTRMDVRTQLGKRYRADDTKRTVNGVMSVSIACQGAYLPNPVPPQNNHGINTVCFQDAGFAQLVSVTWPHEAQHLQIVEDEAQKPINDIYAQWEGVVIANEFLADQMANDVLFQMHNNVAMASLAIHTGVLATHHMWLHQGSGVWTRDSVVVSN